MLKINSICFNSNNYRPTMRSNINRMQNIAFSSRCEDSYCKSTRCVAFHQEPMEVKGEFYPDDYVEKLGSKTYLKDHYVILHLESGGIGEGKNAIKNVLRQSLTNCKTNGRIMLYAEIIDGKSSPAGFYYKLGFRFRNNDEYNKQMSNWLKTSGLKEKAPQLTGGMYLPKENIRHCLYY